MRKSARLLGLEMGRSAREMNALLAEHGYLQGEPGNYSLTDKGRQYGHETDHERGNDRSLSYYTSWSTRSWDEEILQELAGEKVARAGRSDDVRCAPARTDAAERDVDADEVGGFDAFGNLRPQPGTFDDYDDDREPAEEPPAWLTVALIVGVLVARRPRVRRWVRDTVQPGMEELWRKVRSSRSSGD